MASFCPALRSLMHFYRFDNAVLESEFQLRYQRCSIQSCHLTAAMQVPIVLSSIAYTLLVFPIILEPAYWALYSVPLLCSVALTLLPRFRVTDCHLNYSLALCYCLNLATRGVQYGIFLAYNKQRYAQMPDFSPGALDTIDEVESYLYITSCLIEQQLQLLPMLFIGFCPASVVALCSGPVINLLFIALGMTLRAKAFLFVPISLCLAIISVLYCHNVSMMRRSIFLLELQQKAHCEQLQRADGMVNHIVKNAMVEAAGLIETFLDLCMPPPPAGLVHEYLHCAMQRLRAGMVWCRRRRVLLLLMDEAAQPNPTPTSLVALGRGVVSSRTVVTSFTNLTVELDEALTDLILENAVDNAFRHGHPTDPDVRFAITAESMDPAAGTCTVTFFVSNRCHPEHQRLTPERVQSIVRRQHDLSPATPFSDGVGLRHCFLAAKLQGMAMAVAQEGDRVVFRASIVTRLASEMDAPALPTTVSGEAGTLPLGLKISVIDDSASARLLLRHQLSRDIPGCTVDVFGESADDVEPFLSHTLQKADIAILDQHLHWSSGSLVFGTDLVRRLLQAGYQGLVCIRSANTSEHDLQEYSAAGAHCVIDKVVSRSQMVATLTALYLQLTQPRLTPTTSATSQFPSFGVGGRIHALWSASNSNSA